MKSEDTPIKRIQTHDIIVAFAYAQGYGDVLFALKVAKLVRKRLKESKKLTGDVYVVAKEGLGYNYITDVKGDLDFGVTPIKKEEIKAYIDDGIITVSYVIDGPIFSKLYSPLDSIPAAVLLMPEYSEPNPAPISQINVVNKYIKACGNNADNVEYIKTGLPLNDTNVKKKEASVEDNYATARNKTKGPCEGILLSHELMGKNKKENINHWFALRPKYRQTLLKTTDNEFYTTAEYQEKKELSFVYKNKFDGVARFLLIYLERQALLAHEDFKKSHDIFIVCNERRCFYNMGRMLKNLIAQTKALKKYSQINVVNLTTNEKEMLQSKVDEELSLRIIYAKSLDHEEMIALQALSCDFVGMTGDQSFSEAVSADKIIEYEVARKEKRLLIDGYCALEKSESKSAQSAIDVLGRPYSLGGELDTKELAKKLVEKDVIEDIYAVNKIIHEKFDLGNKIMNVIVDKIPAPNDEISQCVIDNNPVQLQKHLEDNTFEDGALQSLLQLAIKYGHVNIVNLILEQPGVNFNHADAFGNTPLILAAQHKQYNVIKAFVEHHRDKIDLYARNQMNRAMFDYLPRSLFNNKLLLLENCGLFGSFDIKEKWLNLTKHIMESNDDPNRTEVRQATIDVSNHVLENFSKDAEIVGLFFFIRNVLSKHEDSESIQDFVDETSKLIETDLDFEQYRFTDKQGCVTLENTCEDAFKDYCKKHPELHKQISTLKAMIETQSNSRHLRS